MSGISDHKRLAQIREMPQGADEKFLLRLIWEYELAMRAAKAELDMGWPMNARRFLRDALADKIEHSDVEKAREVLRAADAKLYRTSDIAAQYGRKR